MEKLVNVTADSVRNRLNLTVEDVDDAKVSEMISDAIATIELETNRTIDSTNCSEAEAAAIKNLAAIYILCHLSGGSAAGLTFSVGDLQVGALSKAPSFDILYREVERLLLKLKGVYMERV